MKEFLLNNYYWFLLVGILALGVLSVIKTMRWEVFAFSALYAICESLYQVLKASKFSEISEFLFYLSIVLLFLLAMVISIKCDKWYLRLLASASVVLRVFRIYFFYSIVTPASTSLPNWTSWAVHRPYVLVNYALIALQLILVAAMILIYVHYTIKKRKQSLSRSIKEHQRAIDEEKITAPDDIADDAFERVKREKVSFDVSVDDK
ncbi:MAG: hypothetical protein PHT58_08690 [Eubacteriales bacterium]|nr:hypothetical protein [Eubacteriales bacterium]